MSLDARAGTRGGSLSSLIFRSPRLPRGWISRRASSPCSTRAGAVRPWCCCGLRSWRSFMLDPPLELLQVLQIRGFAFHGWGLGTPGCPNRFRGMPTMLVRAKFELLGLHMVRSVCVPGGSRRALGAPGLAKPSSFKRPACSDPSSNRPRLTSPSFLPTVSSVVVPPGPSARKLLDLCLGGAQKGLRSSVRDNFATNTAYNSATIWPMPL